VGYFPFVPPPVTAAQITPPLDLSGTAGATMFGAAETADTANRFQIASTGTISWGNGTAAPDTFLSRFGAGVVGCASGFDISLAGKGLAVSEGSGANSKQGTFTLTGGTTQAVPNTTVTANSRIFLTAQVVGGTPGIIGVNSRTPGTSFTVFCVATDTSTYAYEIFEPG
jgi:hypothetical protein